MSDIYAENHQNDPAPEVATDMDLMRRNLALIGAGDKRALRVSVEHYAWLSKDRIAARRDADDELRQALEESVKLQTHYADLLNMHDGGSRLTFTDADAWLARLRELSTRE